MRAFFKSSGRRLRAGWFLPLALLALPQCAQILGVEDWQPGPFPHNDVIMCDIRVSPPASPNDCATQQEKIDLKSLAQAAVMLVEGQNNSAMLDFSPASIIQCPNNLPKKVTFHGPFPDGLSLCVNCAAQIPSAYPDSNAACRSRCIDLVSQSPPNLLLGLTPQQFCSANAHVSTNFIEPCFANACNNPSFVDPRRNQEIVKWAFMDGASILGADGNSLKKDTTTAQGKPYDAGAASDPGQLITTGDGWVEFEANENTKGHAIGVASGLADTDSSLNDIDFAVVLEGDQKLYISVKGIKLNGGDAFRTYNAGDRFRVRFTDDNNDAPHTATMSVTQVTTIPCLPGTHCLEDGIFVQEFNDPHPLYPLRVDASFNEGDAQLTNVTMVRIK